MPDLFSALTLGLYDHKKAAFFDKKQAFYYEVNRTFVQQ